MQFLRHLRDLMQHNPAVTIGLLAVVILGAIGYAWYSSGPERIPPHPAHKAFFMDENTGEVFVKSTHEYAPLNNAQGQPTIVQAVFYTTDGGKTRKLAYLQKYSDEAKRALAKIQDDPRAASDQGLQEKIKEGTFIRSPEKDAQWVTMDSPEASTISLRASAGTPSGVVLQIAKPD